jgi:hypothetical protein
MDLAENFQPTVNLQFGICQQYFGYLEVKDNVTFEAFLCSYGDYFWRNVSDVNLNFGVQQVLVELQHHAVDQVVVFPQFPVQKVFVSYKLL